MYYFLNNTSNYLASGIEHAEYQRLRLFKKHHTPAKIVTKTYQLNAADHLRANGVQPEDCINMIDYFCDNLDLTPQVLTIRDVTQNSPFRVVKDGEIYRCYDQQRELQRVWTKHNKLVAVDHFDGDHQQVRSDFYDSRGFKAKSAFYATADDAQARRLTLEQYYAVNGRIGYEISYRQRQGGVVAVNHRIQLANGQTWSVLNSAHAFTIFLDCLNMANGGENVFISDRSNVTNQPMIAMQTPAIKIEHFHNIHFANYRDPMNSALTYASISETERLAKTNLIITPTVTQADDMRMRLKTKVPITNVPVGYVPAARLSMPRRSMSDQRRIKGKVIAIARLDAQKNLAEAILAFEAAHTQLPWLTFDIYGYADSGSGEEQKLRQLVHANKLEDCVRFMGYTEDMQSVYQSAQLLLMTSRHEGAPLSLVEAASYGVPQLAYDCFYGPAYIIANGQSGYLVNYGDRAQLTARIVTIMQDTQLLQRLSDGAYQRAKDFSEDAVWQQWQDKVINNDQLKQLPPDPEQVAQVKARVTFGKIDFVTPKSGA
ncbi:glycosyltransferase [Lacticaseibacillus baoqingensis]|uniref:Glycosyltransferase n=2 Tax=Lacticaseibacillus baoqingensis TaxID=2486013 RepID=A0ABW4EAF4_9LACO